MALAVRRVRMLVRAAPLCAPAFSIPAIDLSVKFRGRPDGAPIERVNEGSER